MSDMLRPISKEEFSGAGQALRTIEAGSVPNQQELNALARLHQHLLQVARSTTQLLDGINEFDHPIAEEVDAATDHLLHAFAAEDWSQLRDRMFELFQVPV